MVGSNPQGVDFFNRAEDLATSQSVSGLPTDGRTLYVTLWTHLAGIYQENDYVYHASGATYAMEAFAAVDPELAHCGVVLVKLTLVKASGRNYQIAQAVDKGITGNEVWVTLGSRRNGNRLALAAIRQLRPIACSGYNSVFNRQPFRYG